jgi:RNA polymerase sigma-70 factor (ECF subfamily)
LAVWRNLTLEVRRPTLGKPTGAMADIKSLHERILVLRFQAGDEIAFRQLVERYDSRLRYYVRKLLGSVDSADDVLQDVWLDVFRSVTKLAQPAAFSTWLYRIARNRAYRELRRPRHRWLDDTAEVDVPREEATFSAEDAEQIHLLLGKLVPEHREVLVLRFIEDMSYRDIAEVTACPIGTVRSRIYYAKRALQEIMEKERQNEREESGGSARCDRR